MYIVSGTSQNTGLILDEKVVYLLTIDYRKVRARLQGAKNNLQRLPLFFLLDFEIVSTS